MKRNYIDMLKIEEVNKFLNNHSIIGNSKYVIRANSSTSHVIWDVANYSTSS